MKPQALLLVLVLVLAPPALGQTKTKGMGFA